MVVVKQEQPHLGSFIDIPGGIHDKAEENELEAAKRELKEETGLVCNSWKLISCTQLINKIETFHYIFLAYDVINESQQQKLDSGERIVIEYLTIDEVKNLFNNLDVRFLPKDILSGVTTFEELKGLPDLLG